VGCRSGFRMSVRSRPGYRGGFPTKTSRNEAVCPANPAAGFYGRVQISVAQRYHAETPSALNVGRFRHRTSPRAFLGGKAARILDGSDHAVPCRVVARDVGRESAGAAQPGTPCRVEGGRTTSRWGDAGELARPGGGRTLCPRSGRISSLSDTLGLPRIAQPPGSLRSSVESQEVLRSRVGPNSSRKTGFRDLGQDRVELVVAYQEVPRLEASDA
jgi:hypothetical protein